MTFSEIMELIPRTGETYGGDFQKSTQEALIGYHLSTLINEFIKNQSFEKAQTLTAVSNIFSVLAKNGAPWQTVYKTFESVEYLFRELE